MERKLKSFYHESKAETTRRGSWKIEEPKEKRPKTEEKTNLTPVRDIGSKMRYLNKFSNEVESGTFVGFKGKKLKCSILKGGRQVFIAVDEQYLVE